MNVKNVVVAMLLLSLAFYGVGVFAGDMFAGLDAAKQIYGEKITAKDLKGKVVFLEYWGKRCPPCRTSFPHLIELQRQFAKTGKFTVLASHVQRSSEDAVAFCKSKSVNFPVFQQFREPLAPCGRGIPSAVLIDHKGNIVQTGHPGRLYDLVKDLVRSTPNPPPPILGDVKVKYWAKYAVALGKGKPVVPILKLMKQSASLDTPKGREAKELSEAVEAYLNTQTDELAELAETEPALAAMRMKRFLKQARGMPQTKKLNSIYSKLISDSSVKALVALHLEMNKLQARRAKRDSRSIRKKLRALGLKMEQLSEKKGTSPTVAEEAKKLSESL